MSQIDTFFEKLESLSEKNVEVYVPRLKKKIKFKPLNLGQQKDLISSVADGAAGSVRFSKILNDIILDNSEKAVQFLIVDKTPIILQLRVNALGSQIEINDEKFDLNVLINNLSTFKMSESLLTATFKEFGLTIECGVPTLELENKILVKCETSVNAAKDNKLSDSVGLIYIHEIIKYINSITFQEEIVKFSDLTTLQKIKIVEKLPLSLNTKVINFIEDLRKIDNNILKLNEDIILDIDSQFFETS
jgi:hypothetical protein